MCFSDLSSYNLIGLASSLAISIGESLSVEEVTTLAAFVTTLGDNLAIIATQKALNNSKKEESYDSSSLT